MQDNEQKILQKNLHRFLIEDVFNTVTGEDILKISAPNVWYHKDKQLTEGQVKALRNEATAFVNSGLWKILRAELLWEAKKGYSKSKGEADLIAVKVLELLVKTLDDKLHEMSKI